MMNTVALMGRLTRDPELKTTQSGLSIANFAVAVDNGWGDSKRTDFFEVTAWRKTAEFASTYLRKGMLIGLEGRLQQERWEGKNGENRSAVKVVAEHLHFAEKKQESPDFSPMEAEDGELPF